MSFQLLKLAAWQRQLPRSAVKADPSFPPSDVIHAHPSALWSAEAKSLPGILLQFYLSCQLAGAVHLWRKEAGSIQGPSSCDDAGQET